MSDLTLSVRLTADGKDLVGAVRVSREELDKLGGSAKQASGDLGKYSEAQDKATSATRASTSAAVEFIKGLAGYDILRSATAALVDYVKESAVFAARNETLGVVMGVVGKNAGYTAGEMRMYAEAVRASGITMMESQNTVIRLAQAHMDLAQAQRLARLAQDAAVIGFINSSEALNRLIYAVQSAQPEMLRTLGLNVNFEVAYVKLAKQLGVTTQQLTEHEKTQARFNATMEAGTTIAGAYEAAMGTAGKQMTSLARYTEDLKVLRGEIFTEALVIAVNAYTDSLKDANQEARRLSDSEKFKEWGRDLIKVFAFLGDQLLLIKTLIVEIATPLERIGRNIYTLGAGMSIAGGPGSIAEKKAALQQLSQESSAYYQGLDERLQRNRNPSTFGASADAFFAQRDAAAAEKALQGRYDDWTALSAPLQKNEARPGGKAEGQDMKEYVLRLRERAEVTKEATAVDRVMWELRNRNWKEWNESLVVEALNAAAADDAERLRKQTGDEYLEMQKGLIDLQKQVREDDARRLVLNEQLRTSSYLTALAAQHEAQLAELEISLMGRSATERRQIVALKKAELDVYRETERLRLSGTSASQETQEYMRQQAQERALAESRTQVIRDQVDAQKRLTDDLGRGITDALFRGFEAGKSFMQNFLDTLKNSFKTTILRPIVQFAVQPITSAASSALGMLGIPGLGNAAGIGGGIAQGAGLLGQFGAGQTMADFGNFARSIGTIDEMGAVYGVGDAITGFAAANPWTTAALAVGTIFGAKSLFGGGGTPSRAIPDTGDVQGTMTRRYRDLLAALGGAGDAAFGYGANTGAGSENPNFALTAFARGRRIFGVGEDLGGLQPLNDQNLGLQTSRAVLTALQSSTLPQYLRQYLDALVPAAMDKTAIDNALTYATSLKQIREQLDETRQPLEIARDNLGKMFSELSTNAAHFRDDYKRAIDAGIGPEALAKWQALGTAIQQAAQVASPFIGRMGAAVQLQDQVRGLFLSELSPLSPAQRFAQSEGMYASTLAQARAGSNDALAQLGGISRSYLTEARSYYASSQDYTDIYSSVQDSINGLVTDTLNEQATQFASMGLTLKDIADNTKNLDTRIADAISKAVDAWQKTQVIVQQSTSVQITNAINQVTEAVQTSAQQTGLVIASAGSASWIDTPSGYSQDGELLGPGQRALLGISSSDG